MKIKSYLHPDIQSFLDEYDLHSFIQDKTYPVHLLFPHIMKQHIKEFKSVLESKYGFDYTLYFAKKANPSKVFTKTALEQGIQIDVASAQELKHVVSLGFTGEKIECTGPKDEEFLSLAIENNCLISCDSIAELQRIPDLNTKDKKINVLLRISNPRVNYSNVQLKDSRFGILLDDLSHAYEIIKEKPSLNLKGFHIHRSEIQPLLKASYLSEMITQIITAREYGLQPDCVNIGGAFSPLHHVESIVDWNNYLNFICEQLKNNKESNNWRSDFYDLTIINNQVKGLNILKQKVYENMFSKDYFSQILEHKYSGLSIGQFLEEAGISLSLEPGYNLLEQTGISIIKLIDVKPHRGKYLSTCSANSSNLSCTFFESVTDPIFIPAEQVSESDNTTEEKEYAVQLFGNTCSEDDIIMRRPVYVPSKPKVNDIFVFVNTGAYKSYFQDASPLMQQKGKNFEVLYKEQWKVRPTNDN